MAVRITYTDARAKLASLIDLAARDRETIIITRRGKPEVALIAADVERKSPPGKSRQ